MTWIRLLAGAIRWRAASSAVLFLVAMAAVLAAAVGPMYSLAARESVIRTTLDDAAIQSRGLTLVAQPPVRGSEGVPAAGSRAELATALADRDGLGRWFGAGTLTEVVAVRLPSDAGEASGYATELAFREGACAHVRITTGACPVAADEALVSDRSASKLGVSIGASIPYRFSGQVGPPVKVVGIYSAAGLDDAYWFGRNFLTYAPPAPSLVGTPPFGLDALFVARPTIDRLGFAAAPFVTEELPLMVSRVDDSAIGTIQSELAQLTTSAIQRYGVTVQSDLPSIISNLQGEQSQMQNIVALSALQIVLVGLILLYDVVSTSARVREHEVALARLRGHGPWGVAITGLAEPVSLIVIAAPVGALLAWLAVDGAARYLFLRGTPVAIDWLTGAAIMLAVFGGAAAALVASARALLRPLYDQLRTSISWQNRGGVPAVEVAAVSIAIVGLVELLVTGVVRGGRADPLAIIAPGLLVLAAAVAGMRLLRLGALGVVTKTQLATGSTYSLVARRMLRIASSSRRMLIPTLALGLAVFDLYVYSVADANREALATFQVGASRVLVVQTTSGIDLLSAVRTADPSGTEAMAVLQYTWAGGSVLAVDSSRFAQVADWNSGVSDRDGKGIAGWLRASTDPSKLTAVVTPNQVAFNGFGDPSSIHAEGLDGDSLVLDGRVSAAALPRLGAAGAMVDLAALKARQREPADQQTDLEVWLSPSAPDSLLKRLSAQGLQVRRIESAAAAKHALDSQGLPLAFDLMLFSVIAGLALAVGAIVFSLSSETRERSVDFVVLRSSGWTSAALVWTVASEIVAVIVAACVVGVAAGVGGALLAVSSIPESADPSWPLPLEYVFPFGRLALLVAAFVVALAIASGIASLNVLRSARGSLAGDAGI